MKDREERIPRQRKLVDPQGRLAEEEQTDRDLLIQRRWIYFEFIICLLLLAILVKERNRNTL